MNLTGRTETEADLKAMAFDGTLRRVKVGAETTWGHFEIAPQVELGEAVIANVPTLVVPVSVPGLKQNAEITIERLSGDTYGSVVESQAYLISNRFGGSDPGIVKLQLREAPGA